MYLETLEKLDIELTNLCNLKCPYCLRVSPIMKDSLKLSNQIESLDKNKILNNFKGIAELLELAKKNAPNIAKETPVTAQNGHGAVTTHTSENNALHANTKAGIAGQHQQTGNNTYVSNMGNPGKMMISVQFQNTVLNGFVQTRQI